MNELVDMEDLGPTGADSTDVRWELKKLKPKHLQICALLAQGFKNVEVASMSGVTKEYITMLLRMPLIQQEIARKNEMIAARFELMSEQTCDAIADTLKSGSHSDKMKAARLQLEVTGRIGRRDGMIGASTNAEDRLSQLANRLEHLLDAKKPGLYNEEGSPIFEEAEIVREFDRRVIDATPLSGSNSAEA